MRAKPSGPITLNVRVSGTLSDFVVDSVGETGAYENVSEYIRDLIRKDKARVEKERMALLKAELVAAFSAPESTYEVLDVESVIARNRPQAL